MAGSITRTTFARIRGFLRGDGLSMAFQPIADLGTGAIIGFESLARFESRPPRSPTAWFQDAADAGLRRDLELAAARAAVDALPDLPSGAYLTINVSPDVAVSREFVDLITSAPGARIVVEITEHARVADYDRLNQALQTLRAGGVRVAIDDAGAGFANMAHMLRIEADLIKLDIEITRHIDIDVRRKSLVASLVDFARSIGATIVAEGIETETELAALRTLGVQAGQGYHLGRPAPLRLGLHPPHRRRHVLAVAGQALCDAALFMRSRRAAARASRPRVRILRHVALTIVPLMLVPAGTAFAEGAQPGTAGWWVKRRVEDVRLVVALDRTAKAGLHLEFARRRMIELPETIVDGRAKPGAADALADYGRHVEAVQTFLQTDASPPAFRERVVSELADSLAILDRTGNRVCDAATAGANRSSCRSLQAAIGRSRSAIVQAERRDRSSTVEPPEAPSGRGGTNARNDSQNASDPSTGPAKPSSATSSRQGTPTSAPPHGKP